MKNIFSLVVLMLVCLNQAAAEKNLMRLFYTPAERARIDAGRSTVKQGDHLKSTVKQQTQSIQYQGYVKRKGHDDVIWVNNKNTLKTKKPLSDVKVIRVQSDGKVKMIVDGKGIVKLKPGQVLSRSHQKIRETYEIHK